MLEQLNQTLEEEKKTLLLQVGVYTHSLICTHVPLQLYPLTPSGYLHSPTSASLPPLPLFHLCLFPVHLHQINKLLEHNQDMLVKTLESKDQALEDERTFK